MRFPKGGNQNCTTERPLRFRGGGQRRLCCGIVLAKAVGLLQACFANFGSRLRHRRGHPLVPERTTSGMILVDLEEASILPSGGHKHVLCFLGGWLREVWCSILQLGHQNLFPLRKIVIPNFFPLRKIVVHEKTLQNPMITNRTLKQAKQATSL